MKQRALLPIVLVVSLGAVRLVGGCECGEGGAPLDGGPDQRVDAKPIEGGADVSLDGSASNCPAGPPGWLLDSQYDPACGFCYRGATASLPPPIVWESCGPSALPQSAVCRSMKTDWKLGNVGEYLSPLNVGWRHDGTVTLAFTRFEGVLGYRMVADVDGPVRTSLMEVATDDCTLGAYDLRDGRAVYRIYSTANGKPTAGGAYGIAIDEPTPRLYVNRKNEPGTISRSYYVSALGLFESHAGLITRIDWTSGQEIGTIDSSATNGGYVFGTLDPDSKSLYWGAFVGTKLNEIRVWTPDDAGTRDWLSFDADWSQGAGDFSADETDVIWAEGHGRASPSDKFDEVRVMTAPRNNAGPSDAGRTIGRVHPYGIGSGEMGAVGCGYAARTAAPVTAGDATPQESVFVFRLSDGRRWELQQSSAMTFKNPVAITCDEVFINVNVQADGGKPHANIVRVRLDSLGVGLPPN